MKLFINQKSFVKQYGMTNKEIFDKYDYQKHITQKSTQTLGKETINEQNDTQYINETEQLMEQQEKSILLMHDTLKE